jgi:S1-C subfamily serine protease
LLDICGRLIGINTAIVSQTSGWQGIGFAVPANMLSFVLAAAQKGDKLIRRPWLGAKLAPLDAGSAARLGLKRRLGAVVTAVIADSPAARAGLQVNDVVTSIDGTPIEDPNALDYRFTMKGLEDRARLGFFRNGSEDIVEVVPGPAPEAPPRESTRIGTLSVLQGATVVNLSPAVAEELGLDSDAEGVAVTEVDKDSPAQKFGFRRGDILLTANGTKINRVRDVVRLLQNTRMATLEFDRGGDIFFTRITRQPNRR